MTLAQMAALLDMEAEVQERERQQLRRSSS